MSTSCVPPSASEAERGELRFYGRRRGKKLRRRGQDLLQTLLPRLAIAQPEPGEQVDPAALFSPETREVWLEVGFGGGEHAAAQAQAHPDIGLIAGEVFVNGIASLLGHIESRRLGNIRIFAEDVRLLLPALPESCLARVFVLFPDPWPKKRHAERRFIGHANLDQLARVLKDGGELRVASDDPTYIAWARERMAERPDFVCAADLGQRPPDWPATRYEAKALREGRPPAYMQFHRRPRHGA